LPAASTAEKFTLRVGAILPHLQHAAWGNAGGLCRVNLSRRKLLMRKPLQHDYETVIVLAAVTEFAMIPPNK
jgi:hypothetical protein